MIFTRREFLLLLDPTLSGFFNNSLIKEMNMTERKPDCFVPIQEAMRLLGVKRSSYYNKVKTIPGYPRPITEPDGGKKVLLSEILAYQAACIASRK